MVLKEIGVGSAMKLGATVYAGVGFVIGLVIALASLAGGMAGATGDGGEAALAFGGALGIAAVVALPLLYGVLGAIGTAIGAVLYNVAAKVVGGIELRLE